MNKPLLVYLASPYSHPDPLVREGRYQAAMDTVVASMVNRARLVVYSPILHNHACSVEHQLPQTWPFWQSLDFPMLERCDQVAVLMIAGWRESKGIEAEIAFARVLGKPVSFIHSWPEFQGAPVAPPLKSVCECPGCGQGCEVSGSAEGQVYWHVPVEGPAQPNKSTPCSICGGDVRRGARAVTRLLEPSTRK
jgi:hypothetical protein